MTRTRTILLITFAHVATIAACRELRAATPADSAQASQPTTRPTIQKPITREDADLMLREAHGLIEQGRLEDAEKVIARVENAHVQFPFIHTGPTPSGLRKELTRAQRLRGASKALSHEQPTGAKRYLPFARSNSQQSKTTTDPFLARNGSANPAATSTSPSSQSAPAAMADRRLPAVSAPPAQTAAPPAQVSAPQATGARTLDNPFASAGKATGLTASNLVSEPQTPSTPLNYPSTHSAVENNARTPASSAAAPRTASAIASSADANRSWDLPSAPLPRGASDKQFAARSGLMPPKRTGNPTTPTAQTTNSPSKQQAQEQLSAARKALQSGDLDLAEKLTQAANALGVPESQFLPDEDRPSLVAWDIARAKQNKTRQQPEAARPPETGDRYAVRPGQSIDVAAAAPQQKFANPVDYRAEERDTRSNDITPIPLPPVSRTAPMSPAAAKQLTDDGPQMLAAVPGDKPARPQVNSPAADELPLPLTSPAGNVVVSDANEAPKLESPPAIAPPTPIATESSVAAPKPAPVANQQRKSLIDSTDEAQQVLIRKLDAEVLKRQSEAVRLREKDSERALATLREAQQLVKESKLPESTRRELLGRIDKTLSDTQEHAKTHNAQTELDKQNEAVLASIDRDREMKLKLQQKIAESVEEFNRLNHEQRYAEAEIVARRLNEMAPNDPVTQQVWQNAKFIRREMMNRQLVDDKENSFWEQMNAVEESAVNPVPTDGRELVYDEKTWKDLIPKRKGSKERTQRRTERELEIERRLQTPVMLKYTDTSLNEVMGNLSELTGVNIHLDPRGLSQEGVNTDTPITINLGKEISLKSALNLILEPLHLSYVVSDEVLKITSEQLRDGELLTKPYNVADLVTPIPNFVPSSQIGLQGLINDSMAAASRGSVGVANGGPTVLVNDRTNKSVGPDGKLLAQQMGPVPTSSPNGVTSSTVPIGAGPGGMGGAANADFDSLIDLIVSTVSTDTWAENGGGTAEIRPFPTNLSLVISQTQAVHEEIADLLQQLRRLQDLQVTIEVRFIRLNDSFFERIGIDFDMDINDNGYNDDPTTTTLSPFGTQSNTVGLLRPAGTAVFPNFTSDLDVPFRQDSFDLTQIVPFGGPVGGGLNFGFAILSDIEAFFLIEAAQGDRRTNVLQAPKVTLFNGQQAFVADATSRPFVVGVIPVVGEFASAQQPVIVVLNEGTMMTIQAVVSDDRRYVRMTIVPFFTQIGDVDTFTFEGSTSSTSASSKTDGDDDGKNEKEDESEEKVTSGVTVQLPSFSFISVVTTVSVPDGGTVLLGGIKRLSEGRNEFGVPLLSKVPYVNRLFKNVGLGRETDSIMMMVTPRIIIQEEEEERLGIAAP